MIYYIFKYTAPTITPEGSGFTAIVDKVLNPKDPFFYIAIVSILLIVFIIIIVCYICCCRKRNEMPPLPDSYPPKASSREAAPSTSGISTQGMHVELGAATSNTSRKEVATFGDDPELIEPGSRKDSNHGLPRINTDNQLQPVSIFSKNDGSNNNMDGGITPVGGNPNNDDDDLNDLDLSSHSSSDDLEGSLYDQPSRQTTGGGNVDTGY